MFKLKFNTLYEIVDYRDVLVQLVRQQLVLRYRRTFLGYFWTLINPILMMSVTAVLFATLFKVDLKTYAVFLFAGMIPWNFFSSTIIQSSNSLIYTEGLIKKIYLPKAIFPISVSLALFIDSILAFFSLFIIILLIGGKISFALLYLPISYLLLFVFSLGLALIVSVVTVFFRDLQHVIVVAMQAWFFLTPVFYKHEALVGKISWLVAINPVVPFIELFRNPLYLGDYPEMMTFVKALSIAICSLFVGLYIFLKYEKKIVYRL